MKTWKVEWRLIGTHSAWREFKTWPEEWGREEHAEMRVKGYWEKLGLPMEFRVVEVVPPESPQLLPAAQE